MIEAITASSNRLSTSGLYTRFSIIQNLSKSRNTKAYSWNVNYHSDCRTHVFCHIGDEVAMLYILHNILYSEYMNSVIVQSCVVESMLFNSSLN